MLLHESHRCCRVAKFLVAFEKEILFHRKKSGFSTAAPQLLLVFEHSVQSVCMNPSRKRVGTHGTRRERAAGAASRSDASSSSRSERAAAPARRSRSHSDDSQEHNWSCRRTTAAVYREECTDADDSSADDLGGFIEHDDGNGEDILRERESDEEHPQGPIYKHRGLLLDLFVSDVSL